jgi:N-acetylmuramoyl-L-alanine amidase
MKTILAAAAILIAVPAIADECDYENQVEVLALNMYHEARGEGYDEMQMVGEVTLNRVEHAKYPDNICDVVYQRRQFSWTYMRIDHTPHEIELWEAALEIAEKLISGDADFFNNGATHFLNPNKVRRMPTWTETYELVGRMGNHVFYERPS